MDFERHLPAGVDQGEGSNRSSGETGEVARPAPASLSLRLVAMRRTVGAEACAVFSRVAGAGRFSAQLSLVLSEGHERSRLALDELISPAPARVLTDHAERSSKPLLWSGGGALVLAGDLKHVATTVVMPQVRVPGLAVPVRLGTMGNGMVVLAGPGMEIAAGPLLTLHRQAFRVMAQLLRSEVEKAAPRQTLSERELACLQKAGDGCRSEEIAERLGLSVHTVNAYLSAATAKLDSVNRIQAIAKAIRLGFIA